MDEVPERRFTLEEAEAELPHLRELLPELREARRRVLASGERVRGVARRNGGGREGTDYWRAIEALRRGVEDVAGRGIVLRDADSGLVDFPAEREGRLVYLCWRLGEDRVAHWHDVDAGFGGRRPL